MRVVLDVTPLVQHRGMGRYVRELLREFLRMEVRVRGSVRTGRPLRGDLIRYLREARRNGIAALPAILLRFPGFRWGDVYHAVEPASWIRVHLPIVLTFHDFAQFRHPTPRFRKLRRLLDRHPPDRAIAVSRFTAEEAEGMFPELEGRIRVVHHGVRREVFHPRSEEELLEVLSRWNLKPRGYFLFAGEADDRKNLGVLVRVAADPSLPPLVMVGTTPGRLGRYLDPGSPNLRLIPPQPEEVLAALYAGALAFLFPSREEGFGLPVLEAMASGVPVVTTRCSAIPEVGGDAPLYLPPDDPEAWWTTARELARGDVSVEERVARGLARAATFTWETTARKTLAVYREALEDTA